MRKQIHHFTTSAKRSIVRGSHTVGRALRPTPRPSMFVAGIKFGAGFMLVSVLTAIAMYGVFGYLFLAVLS